jgi:hypothetical protein
LNEPGTTVSVVASMRPICSSVSDWTGAGKPYWSVAVAEPVNQVMTTLVSVTVATSRSVTSMLDDVWADAGEAVATVAAIGAAAARLPQMRAWRREGRQQSMGQLWAYWMNLSDRNGYRLTMFE